MGCTSSRPSASAAPTAVTKRPEGARHAAASASSTARSVVPHAAERTVEPVVRARGVGPDAMPLQRAIEACVGKGGDRAPLREYIIERAPTALDGLKQLCGSALDSAVANLKADYGRWRAEPRASRAPPASARQAAGGAHTRIEETALRGISLPQLRAFAADAAKRCKAEQWTSMAPGQSKKALTAQTMTLYDLAKYAIQPLANSTGLSVVETLASGPQPPAWFVSHWWGEPVADFIKCLERHCKDRALGEATAYYWVCAYALRQSALGEELQGGVGVSPFMRAIQLTDGTVSVLDPKAIAVSRAWCALELYETILGRDAAYLHDIYTVMSNAGPIGLVDGLAAKSGKKKEDTMDKAEREQEFPDAALCGAKGFALAHAEASRAEDLVAIRGQVGADDKVLDATVRARFGVARLHAVLRADNPGGKAELRALLDDLRGSKLRKLSALLHAKSHPALALLGAALPASLEELTLYDAGPSVAPPLCKLIDGGRLPLLRTLHLCDSECDDAIGVALAKALTSNCALLASLNLEANELGDKAGVALAKAFEHNSTLTELNLGSNSLGDEAGVALAKAFEHNSSLKALDLRLRDRAASRPRVRLARG
ncbi:hypothetical protein KFE25_004388 [Diacronema lutheri]|uniref:Uncharacterized protein n=1 Tax=Diacronema lutheri TaxID=2081491 RepID=A0A8J5X358_DIALT|nr:hypothetical protein KFE25_004388 [Diacronema lutheri]